MRTEIIEIPVSLRTEKTKGARKRLRAEGKVPAVIYGRGVQANLDVAVEERIFHRTIPPTAWYSTPMKLVVQDPAYRDFSPTVMLTEVQHDLTTGRVVAADFHVVSAEEKVRTRVPVVHVGESPGVKMGGILEHLIHEVVIEALVTDIPTTIKVDVSALDIGERIRVTDLPALPGVEIVDAPDEVILLVAAPRAVEEVAPAPAEGAVVEEVAEPERVEEE